MFKIQGRGFNIRDLTNSAKVVHKTTNKAKDLSNKVLLDDIMKIADVSRKYLPDPKNFLPALTIFGTEITLTNIEIQGIIKVTKSSENREVVVKGTTRKIFCKMEDFEIFLGY